MRPAKFMGMFDYVHVQIACPGCGETVSSFQSKDAECVLDVISPERINRFYGDCNKCHMWIEFERPREVELTIRDRPYDRCEVEAMGFKLVGLVDGRPRRLTRPLI